MYDFNPKSKMVLFPAKQPHNERKNNAQNNARGNREIKTEVFLLNGNIPG